MDFTPYTENELSNLKRFQTYGSYLVCLSNYLKSLDRKNLLTEISQSNSFQSIQTGRSKELADIEKLLRNSWATEIQLHFPTIHDELASVSNQWATVQLYYCLYISLVALLKASNQVVDQKHQEVLNTVSSLIEKRPNLFFPAIKVLCKGDGNKYEYLNIPDGVDVVTKASNLSNEMKENIWASLPLFLKTTRERRLKQKFDNYKKKNKVFRLTSDKKFQLASKVPPTSIFDCFKRLREISNYKDSDYLTSGIITNDQAIEFNIALRHICWFLLLNIELLIARNVGKNTFEKWVNNSPKCDIKNLSSGLCRRRFSLVKNAW